MQTFLIAYLIVASIACVVTIVLLVVFALTPKKTEEKQTVVTPISQPCEKRRKTTDYKQTRPVAQYTPQISARDQARLVFSAVLWGAVIPFTMFKVLNRSK